MLSQILQKRLITALFLVLLVILGLYFVPFFLFVIVVTAIMLFASWEWSILIGCRTSFCRSFYVFLSALIMLCIWFFPVQPVLWLAVLWWFVACYLIFQFSKGHKQWCNSVLSRALMGFMVIMPCWIALIKIRAMEHGASLLLFMLLMIWSVDTGAYFAGKKYGKTKLAPAVSPGKTWQGVYGGVVSITVVALLGCILFEFSLWQWPFVMTFALIILFYAVIGDLFESMLKRCVGIKDVGNYLPGHGGLLDRIDSMIAVAPIFLLGLSWFVSL